MSDDADLRATALAGRAFGAAADAYVAGRPDYPADAVRWLVGDAGDVVDVGAGTGKLTAALIGSGRRVTAVEPDPGMLSAPRREVPSAVPLVGTAEALPLPLPDAVADAVVPYRTPAFRAARLWPLRPVRPGPVVQGLLDDEDRAATGWGCRR